MLAGPQLGDAAVVGVPAFIVLRDPRLCVFGLVRRPRARSVRSWLGRSPRCDWLPSVGWSHEYGGNYRQDRCTQPPLSSLACGRIFRIGLNLADLPRPHAWSRCRFRTVGSTEFRGLSWLTRISMSLALLQVTIVPDFHDLSAETSATLDSGAPTCRQLSSFIAQLQSCIASSSLPRATSAAPARVTSDHPAEGSLGFKRVSGA